MDAVRKRAERGQLASEREGSRLYIMLDMDATESRLSGEGDMLEELLEAFRERVAFLERELERRGGEAAELRRIIAALTQRIPELPAASSQEPSESSLTSDEQPQEGARPEEQAPTERRSWWRRMFGSG